MDQDASKENKNPTELPESLSPKAKIDRSYL